MLIDMQCPNCGQVIEYLIDSNDDTEIPCENCSNPLTKEEHRVYTAEGVPNVVTQTGVGKTQW